MKIIRDPEAGAVHFVFAEGRIARTVALDAERRYDLDAAGALIGVKILLPEEGHSISLVEVPRATTIGGWLLGQGYVVRGMFYDTILGHPSARL